MSPARPETLAPLLWRLEDKHAAVVALGRASGLADPGAVPDGAVDAARALGLELHSVHARYETLPALLRRAGPAVLAVFRPEGPPALLAVCGPVGLGDRVPVLGPDGRRHRVPAAALLGLLREAVEASVAPAVEATLRLAGLPPGRARGRARAGLVARRLQGRPIGGATLVRAAPHAGVRAHARDAGIPGPLLLALGARLATSVVSVGGWGRIGEGALAGRISPGWLWGWGLLLLTALALGQLGALAQGELAIRAGAWTKAQLLRGAMAADPGRWRREGAGGALARVGESQAIEDLVLTGGLGALLALVDLAVAGWVLAQGAAGLPLLLVLLLGGLALGGVALRLFRLRQRWTARRRALTALLVERMAGHHTRLAQAEPGRITEGEDAALASYHQAALPMDRLRVAASALLGGGWSLVALGALALPFVIQGSAGTGLAVAIGGVLLGQAALATVGAQLDGLVGAAVSWGEVGPLLQAAHAPPAPARVAAPAVPAPAGAPLLRADALEVGWPGRPPVVSGAALQLRVGDRVLLTGPSGAGKSTLAGVLTGARAPRGGLLLLRGLDRASLGPEQWRRMVAQAPQFHENHIFENTLAFNLLMGAGWPASADQLAGARALCEALGLGPLLARMPAGLNQVVGASGWQLSHGERSRVFLARALLQGAELVVLDESFAALDPASLRRCLAVALARAPTLVVIAHP